MGLNQNKRGKLKSSEFNMLKESVQKPKQKKIEDFLN